MTPSKILSAVVFLLLGASLGYFLSFRGEDAAISQSQKGQIEQIVHDYLIREPEVLMQAAQELQSKAQKLQSVKTSEAISESSREILGSKSPVLGNPKGNVTLVKFMDYQCGHCKEMEGIVQELIHDNPNLKVKIEELPIFGGESEVAAKAAIASESQGKFPAFHEALLQEKQRLSDDRIWELAKKSGVDVEKLKKDMNEAAIQQQIEKSFALARKLGIQGTPFFIVIGESGNGKKEFAFIAGATSKQEMQSLIDKVQGKPGR